MEYIGKGKVRQPYEFGVKVGIAITAKSGLMVGARSFPGNPYVGDTLAEHWEQTAILTGVEPEQMIVDLGYRGRELAKRACCTRASPSNSARATGAD